MTGSICVFCSSSEIIPKEDFEMAETLGKLLAGARYSLVYGGAKIGLMGAVARGVHAAGGHVVGVIPDPLRRIEVTYEHADEMVVTRDLRQRKAIMAARSTAFVALPGGFGTLEEIIEVLTLKQLGFHNKPIVFLNQRGFFGPLLALFEQYYQEGFARRTSADLYHVAADPEETIAYLRNYRPSSGTIEDKLH